MLDELFQWLTDSFADIVSLCNDNSGFISAILAVVTIVISIKIGRLPYQKKMFFCQYRFLSSFPSSYFSTG